MRTATLDNPPLFRVTDEQRGYVVLASDTGAVAHLFIAEIDVMRLLLLADGNVTSPPSWAIAPGAEDIEDPGRDRLSLAGFSCPTFTSTLINGVLMIATAQMRVSIRLHGLFCHWEQRVGQEWRTMQQDRPTQSWNFGWWDARAHHYVARKLGERFYGLGEKTGSLNRAGRRFRMLALDPMGYDAEHTDPLYKSINYLMTAQTDSTCHGSFYDSVAEASFDLGAELDNYHGPYRHFVTETGDIDLWMIAGPSPAAVTQRFTWLTGKPASTPNWALSYSGSTMHYTDHPQAQAQMDRFLAEIAEHHIPCKSFHLSSGYTSIGDKRYVFHWNREKFPEPAKFAARYAEHGVRLVANIKPALLVSHPLFTEVAASNLFIRNADGGPLLCQFWDDLGAYLDFTNPATADWWRDHVITQLLDVGIAATWNDNNEYEIWDSKATIHGFGQGGAAIASKPVQPLLMARASRHAQIAHRPDETPYVVTRSGGTGLHRYAQTWTGDNRTNWASLKWNIQTALGLALSGVSNIGHDVGGFAGPAPDPELFIRWIQAGVTLPRFSIHSWNDDGTVNEPWMYPEILPTVRKLMQLREAIVPVLADLLANYRENYAPVLRPIWYQYPDASDHWSDSDAFLLGDHILVAPVTAAGVTRAAVPLPPQGQWMDLRSSDIVRGPVVDIPAALDAPPVFLVRTDGVTISPALSGLQKALANW